ncbi:hypothetical protein V502_07238 [Pseudogymnoascus sp. VKM F-4520 (FW-2644)]|nr:hypothetical protein V502_07238 [Pseudogymnoascus sp. VKM F-4520 (FW-2644)]
MDVDSNMLPDSSGDLRCSSQLGISTVRPASSRLLPTRVSKACARCRRKKSRCDAYRPCSLCVRANATCIHITDPNTLAQVSLKVRDLVVDKSNVDEDPLALGQNPRNDSLYSSPTTQFAPDSDCTVPRSSGSLGDSPTSVYQDTQSSMDITRKIIRMHGRNVVKRATSAIPDGQDQIIAASRRQSFSAKREAHSILGVSLPSKEIINDLLEEYFDSVHWFSLVIYGPSFRRQYDSVADGYAYQSQKGFLILLATVLGIASWYRAETSVSNSKFSNEDWGGWRVKLFAVAETRFLELMDERSLASLQTCLLLGTYHVYHGRPNASLALLGATIKIAQAMSLHRESVRSGSDENEERKRVWWTIYTWDRFASITYGRPLGINDSDCNVSLPADINEWARPQTANQQGVLICFSTYQSQLSKRSSLSQQSGVILQDVIQLLLDCETQAMLGPACGGISLDEETAHGSSSLASYQSTVQDAPHVSRSTNLQANSGSSTNVSTNPSMDEMLRLNESLSFVQKAFFPSNDFDDNSATPIIPPTQQHGSFGNNSYSDDWPPANADGFENPESYPEDFGAIDNDQKLVIFPACYCLFLQLVVVEVRSYEGGSSTIQAIKDNKLLWILIKVTVLIMVSTVKPFATQGAQSPSCNLLAQVFAKSSLESTMSVTVMTDAPNSFATAQHRRPIGPAPITSTRSFFYRDMGREDEAKLFRHDVVFRKGPVDGRSGRKLHVIAEIVLAGAAKVTTLA